MGELGRDVEKDVSENAAPAVPRIPSVPLGSVGKCCDQVIISAMRTLPDVEVCMLSVYHQMEGCGRRG